MARGRPVVVIQVAFVLAYTVAGSHAAFGQTGHNRPGLGVSLPSINLLGLVTTTPTSVDLRGSGAAVVLPGISVSGVAAVAPAAVDVSSKGASVTLPGAGVANVATVTSASVDISRKGVSAVLPGVSAAGLATVTPASVDVSGRGVSAVLPGVSVAGVATVTPTSVTISGKGATLALPNVDVAGISLASTPLSVNLTGQGPLLDLPAVAVGVAGQPVLTLQGNSALGEVLNQVSPIAQMFANIGSAEAFAPIEHLLNGLAFSDNVPPGCGNADSSVREPLPASNIWAWNAATFGSTDHDGYRVSTGDGASCGSTLPFQTTQRAQLPGVVWDASTALGLKRGTLHFGLSGGTMEMDTQIEPTAALRDAGFTQGGTARLTTWSVGGFSLLTTDNWYAGSAFGSVWGRTESQNFVLGSASDHDTSTLIVAGFVGTIVPLTETLRFDLRGTLTHQRTVGEAHVDTLGMIYGDHTIAASDAMLSGRLFGIFRQGALTLRPFLQAGVTQHLQYDNQLEAGGVTFIYQEADTSVFAATGLDLEISNTLQLSVGVRQDYSRDSESLTGRFGFTARLN